MTYHYKNKKYKLKPFGLICILLAVSIIVCLSFFLIDKITNKNESIKNPAEKPTAQVFQSSQSQASKPESKPSSSPSSKPESKPSSSPSSKPESEPNKQPVSSNEVEINAPINPNPKYDKNAWNLILLNRDNLLKQDLKFEKKQYDGQYIDAKVAPYYEKMCADAKADGVDLFLRSGYRNISLQKTYYDSNVNRYLKQGESKQEAIRLTDQYYSRPGGSEHHSGLALDILSKQYHNEIRTLDERFEKTKAFSWLSENAVKYGFILRYPRDKVSLTKINYEPWHYRFVGVDHATYMKKNNLCLEEYAKIQ
ncbi:MAG: M15 family metallopeptidase [Oscillospiraceae bacterium]